ncbi:MAG: hypothetical protein HY262_07100 [Chloroflexi bacterium]|nr:hypothetical protein [Chloroflexota bacterium]
MSSDATQSDDLGMKSMFVVALWVFAFWYLGSAVALGLGTSDLLGPILGLAAGALVGIHGRRVTRAREQVGI